MIGQIALWMFLTTVVTGIFLLPIILLATDLIAKCPWYSVEGLQDIANLHDEVVSQGAPIYVRIVAG